MTIKQNRLLTKVHTHVVGMFLYTQCFFVYCFVTHSTFIKNLTLLMFENWAFFCQFSEEWDQQPTPRKGMIQNRPSLLKGAKSLLNYIIAQSKLASKDRK